MKERIDAFHKYGVRVIPYYNIRSREVALAHPEWQQKNAIKRAPERFIKNCLCSEGYRAYAKKQLETLASRYVINALNTMPGYDATVNDVNIYLQNNKKIVSAYNITAKNSVPFEEKDGCVRISLSRIGGFAMTELKYGENEK